jgi:ACS family tartrate transporter-like MFS transporter
MDQVPAAMLVIGWLSDHYRKPRGLLLACLITTGTGLAAAALVGSAGASAIGIAILSSAGIGIHSLKAPFWAVAGGIAWINSVGNLGGYFGPSIIGWLMDHLGGYQAGIYALAAVQLVAIVVTLALRPRAEIKAA